MVKGKIWVSAAIAPQVSAGSAWSFAIGFLPTAPRRAPEPLARRSDSNRFSRSTRSWGRASERLFVVKSLRETTNAEAPSNSVFTRLSQASAKLRTFENPQ